MAVGALLVGKEIIDQASGAISGKITALIKGSEQVLTPALGPAFFAQLNGRKFDLYTATAKDATSSLWNDSNSGNAVAIVVTQAANAASLPPYYKFKLRAVAFNTFGNSAKAAKENAKAGSPPITTQDVIKTATQPTNIALLIAAGVVAYLAFGRK